MAETRVSLIHHSDANGSMERYSRDLYRATSGYAQLYSLVYGPKDSRPEEARILQGVFSKNHRLFPINYFFPQVTVRSYRRVVEETHKEGGVVHYTAGYIYPYKLEQRDVVTIHDLYVLLYPSRVPLIERVYSQRSLRKFKSSNLSSILTNSSFSKRVLEENSFDSKITVVYLPISESFKNINDRAYARKSLGLPPDKKIVLSISNLQWRKNLGGIMKAMESLDSDYLLVRVGPRVGDSINFEHLSDTEMNLLYNAADLLLYPSFYEGFGYAPLEAAKVGLPVVVSDIPVFQEVLGDYPVYVNPSDPADIRRGITEALNTKKDSTTIDFGKFSLTRFREEMMEFYRRS